MDLMTTSACTLPTRERPLRLAEFEQVFAESLTAVETGATQATLRLSGGPGLGARLQALTARESSCCNFFEFTVTGPDEDLCMTIAVPAQHSDLLSSLIRSAEQAGRAAS